MFDINLMILSSYFVISGFAFRQCDQTGNWESPNVSQCQTVELKRLNERAEELKTLVENVFVDDNRDLTQVFMPEILVDIVNELSEATNTSSPLLPNDVPVAAYTLNNIIL